MSKDIAYQPGRVSHRLAYKPAEAAALLGCTRQHLYNMIARGEIRSVKLGSSRLIAYTELLRLAGVEESAPTADDAA